MPLIPLPDKIASSIALTIFKVRYASATTGNAHIKQLAKKHTNIAPTNYRHSNKHVHMWFHVYCIKTWLAYKAPQGAKIELNKKQRSSAWSDKQKRLTLFSNFLDSQREKRFLAFFLTILSILSMGWKCTTDKFLCQRDSPRYWNTKPFLTDTLSAFHKLQKIQGMCA